MDTEPVKLYVTLILPALGGIVVTTITPLEARDPYIAVAAASFNKVIDSILFGSMSYIF